MHCDSLRPEVAFYSVRENATNTAVFPVDSMLSYGEVKRYIPTPFHSTNRVSVARLMLCIVCGPCFTAASARVCSICAAITYYIALAHRRNTYAQLEETVPTRAQYFTLWMADWNDSKFHSPLSRVMQSCSEQIGSQNPMIFSHGVGKSKIKSQYVYIYINTYPLDKTLKA